jgi:hypothetical protein
MKKALPDFNADCVTPSVLDLSSARFFTVVLAFKTTSKNEKLVN